MFKPFSHILLIDNNRVSNFFNEIILKSNGLGKNVICIDNCQEALHFLNPKKTLNPIPDVIFLNLHTPIMNGWEFLEEYKDLYKQVRSNIIIVYSEELLEEEELKLSQYSFIKAIVPKALDASILSEVYNAIDNTETLKLTS